MRKFWESTLTGRVIITLGCGITAFWLLSESIMFYSRYLRSMEIVHNELAWKLSHVVDLEDDRYRQAEKQILTVMNLWNSLKSGAVLSVAVKHAIFLPFDKVAPNRAQVQKALEIIEISGDPDDCSQEEAFLLLPGQGIVFHKPDSLAPAYLRQKMQAVLALAQLPARHGYHWGRPFPGASKNFYVTVAVIQPDTGIMAGKNVEVKEIVAPNHALQDSIQFAIQSDAGVPPVFNKGSEEAGFALSDLSHCDPTMATRVKDFYIVCKPLAGPPWRIVARYPVSAVAGKALVLLLGTLPWTLMLFLLLLLTMFLVLWLQVGRPLQHMIEIIDKSRPPDLNQHLPERRKDELGRIASAYNRFLITIKTHYRTLESRVCERTRELDEARCIAELMRHRKREHIAGISHELRTPLGGIVGALSLLQRSRLPASQQELVNTARLSSDYLLAIINDLLDFSHIEAGQLELSFAQTALLPLLDQAMLTIHLKAQEKQLALRTLVMADVPSEMLLDRMRVQQILINLLGNAVKFTGHGHIHLLAELRGGMLAITVEDSGTGIPEASQRDIFMPFMQVRSHENGNGLGLAIASRLARLMGGGILLDSQVGVGSCFTLLLPILPLCGPSGIVRKFDGALLAPPALHMQLGIWGIAAEAGDNPRLDAAELVYLPGRLLQRVAALLDDESAEDQVTPVAICPWTLKILLVDDVAVNRAIVGKMLRELGQQVETAASGQEALQLGRQHVFDLVLMDVRMPGMDGMQTTQRWRDPGCGMLDQDAPIIALTANAMPAESERVKAAGMNDILTKPVGMEQLMQAIASAAALQLQRGVDLAPNQVLQKPLLNLVDSAIRDQLHATFKSLFDSIAAAWQSHERAALADLLHVLKGCAGQGGVERVGNAAEQLEVLLQHGGWPSQEDIDRLGQLLMSGGGV